jgi:hypothetical protein
MVHGRTGEVEDDKHPGCPSTSKTEENIEKISEIAHKDQCLSIQMIAEMVNMDKGTVRSVRKWSLKTSIKYKKRTGKTFALTTRNESQNSQMCLKMSSHVMKPGFFNTIQKQRGNRCIGRHPLHRE